VRPLKWLALLGGWCVAMWLAQAWAGPRDLEHEFRRGDDVCVVGAPLRLDNALPETLAVMGGVVELGLCPSPGAPASTPGVVNWVGARTPTRVGPGIYKSVAAWEKSSRWIAEAQAELARLRALVSDLHARLSAAQAENDALRAEIQQLRVK